MNKRIIEIRKEIGKTQREFAQLIGIKQPTMSAIENGTLPLTDRNIIRICQEFGVSEEWLRTGTGPMFIEKTANLLESLTQRFQLDALDQRIVMEYVTLSAEQRGLFKHFLKSVLETAESAENAHEQLPVPYAFKRTVPILGRVAGGHPILALEDGEESVQTDINCDAALLLCGDSMEPEYPDGCLLLVKRQPELHQGDLGIVLLLKGADIAEATFKKVLFDDGHVVLKSLNPVYEDSTIRSIDVLIFGKVVGSL